MWSRRLVEALSPEHLEELRAGRATRERKLAVCSGAVHLSPVDRAEILAVLAADHDAMVAERAQLAILVQPLETFGEALKRPQAVAPLFVYCAKNLADKPGICDALIQNNSCPAAAIVPVVGHLSTSAIQALMEELDRVSASPALASALEHSSSITVEQKQQLHLLRGPQMDEAALHEVVADEPDPVKRKTLLQRLGVGLVGNNLVEGSFVHLRTAQQVELLLLLDGDRAGMLERGGESGRSAGAVKLFHQRLNGRRGEGADNRYDGRRGAGGVLKGSVAPA